METVIEIFNDIQKSEKAHKVGLKRLQSLMKANKDVELNSILSSCLDKVLVFPKNHANVERTIKFLSIFIASLDETCMQVVTDHICSRLSSLNKLVRQRACQLLAGALEEICSNDCEISCDLLENLSEQIVVRLKDKIPAVRVWAIKAISRLQNPEDVEDKATSEVIRLMNSDNSTPVRLAAVEHVSICDHSLGHLLSRLKDIKPEVRVAAFARVKEIPIAQLSIEARSDVIKTGLADREDKVRTEAKSLVMKWLASLNDSVSALLRQLNPIEWEEEAQLLAAFVMEELMSQDAHLGGNLRGSVKESFSKWNSGMKSITPTEILWVYTRCSYSKSFCSELIAADICEAILPDAIVLCNLIAEIKDDSTTLSSSSSSKREFVAKYLIKTSALVDRADVSGVTKLLETFKTLLADVNTPYDLIEPILNSYKVLYSDATKPLVEEVLSISEAVKSDAAAAGGEGKGNEVDIENEDDENETVDMNDARAERALQVLHWIMKSSMSSVDATSTLVAEIDSITPFILTSLQQPNCDVRCLAVSCLGLCCLLSEEICTTNRGIIMQVASGGFEEEVVSIQALISLVDIAMVSREKYKNDNELCNLLLRLQNSGDPSLVSIASESACKLLFNGVLSDPRLFAHLLKLFFMSEQLEGTSDEMSSEINYEQARLQQLLSLYFMCGEQQEEKVVLDAVPVVLADLTSEMRDGNLNASSMAKMVKNLLLLCDSMNSGSSSSSTKSPKSGPSKDKGSNAGESADQTDNSETIDRNTDDDEDLLPLNTTALRILVQERVCACLCKEILKLGSSKWLDKAITKELVKLLPSLQLDEWLTSSKATALLSIMDVILNSSQHDKASMKALESITSLCEARAGALDVGEMDVGGDQFMALAPGLADLVELGPKTGRMSGESSTQSSICSAAPRSRGGKVGVGRGGTTTGRGGGKKSKSTIESDDSEDEEEDGNDDEENGSLKPKPMPLVSSTASNVGTTRVLVGRSSKSSARSKISAQLADTRDGRENVPLA